MAAYEYCFDIGGLDSEPWRSVSISCRIGITVTMEMLKILIHLKFDGHRYQITAKEGGLAVGYGTVPFEVVLSSIPPLPLSPTQRHGYKVSSLAVASLSDRDTCVVQRPGCHAVALRLALLGLGPREWVR
jgi:hypothetical protein